MGYREMSKRPLRQKNPRELKRLKEAGILEQTLGKGCKSATKRAVLPPPSVLSLQQICIN